MRFTGRNNHAWLGGWVKLNKLSILKLILTRVIMGVPNPTQSRAPNSSICEEERRPGEVSQDSPPDFFLLALRDAAIDPGIPPPRKTIRGWPGAAGCSTCGCNSGSSLEKILAHKAGVTSTSSVLWIRMKSRFSALNRKERPKKENIEYRTAE